MRLIIVLMIGLTGCQTKLHSYTHPDFVGYLNEFKTLYSGKVNNLVVKYSVVYGNFAALCERHSSGQKVIKVNKVYWDGMCLEQRRALIFHELGHCILNREHTLNHYSYMYPSIGPCSFYMMNSTQLDTELFN